MIIGGWYVEENYIIIELDFTKEEMHRLEKAVGIKKADCTSWVTCKIQANRDNTDCSIVGLWHYTYKEIHNGKRGYEYDIPVELFSDDAISFLLDFAREKLECKTKFEVIHSDFSIDEQRFPSDYYFSEEEKKEEPIDVSAIKYEVYGVETGNSYGIFDTYEEAYEQKIEINHRIHIMCGGNYYVDLDIREINK